MYTIENDLLSDVIVRLYKTEKIIAINLFVKTTGIGLKNGKEFLENVHENYDDSIAYARKNAILSYLQMHESYKESGIISFTELQTKSLKLTLDDTVLKECNLYNVYMGYVKDSELINGIFQPRELGIWNKTLEDIVKYCLRVKFIH